MIWFSNVITERKKVSYLGQTLWCDKGEAAAALWCFLLLGLILSKDLKNINVFITCEFVVRICSKQDILSWQKCQALMLYKLDNMFYQSILLKKIFCSILESKWDIDLYHGNKTHSGKSLIFVNIYFCFKKYNLKIVNIGSTLM